MGAGGVGGAKNLSVDPLREMPVAPLAGRVIRAGLTGALAAPPGKGAPWFGWLAPLAGGIVFDGDASKIVPAAGSHDPLTLRPLKLVPPLFFIPSIMK